MLGFPAGKCCERFVGFCILAAWLLSAVVPCAGEEPSRPRFRFATGASCPPQLKSVSHPDSLDDSNILYPERLSSAYTIVLPGVLGTTPYNTKLLDTLQNSDTAIEYFDWTEGVPFYKRRGLWQNKHNCQCALEVANRIAGYKQAYPDRPVHLFALSAGAGIACEALTMLPMGCQADSVILLGPALSPGYDMKEALKGTRNGIDSYQSVMDIPVLVGLTTIVGTIDGQHSPAVGAVGFVTERSPRLRQHFYNPKMIVQGHYGGHFGWTAPKFVEQNLLPIMQQAEDSLDQDSHVRTAGHSQ
ncbi:MAG: hypothetical protein KDA81_03560 [Planctomycetaceae bacterium]|nr:hypothetical protein [Planctomycetaceae bacterium]